MTLVLVDGRQSEAALAIARGAGWRRTGSFGSSRSNPAPPISAPTANGATTPPIATGSISRFPTRRPLK
jgi:hypothetical protein